MATGMPFRIEIRNPTQHPQKAKFAVYGLLRPALYSDVVALPAGIGSMTFPPCILLPSQQPTLFTLTDNLLGGDRACRPRPRRRESG